MVGSLIHLDNKHIFVNQMQMRSRRTQLGVRHVGKIVPGDVSGDATSENKNWWLLFTTTIMGPILVSIFTSSRELPVYILTRNKVKFSRYPHD
ncbi:hypothetical protein PVK06_012571 [Gossypium arboreum]|uniref:Uncharacterized protein n=1 Tax=Gossypium arboreum TaxID=29729 RepID=A0ABR0QBR7_GOSAR|nr:hypothetical protein PVK06_012571 [Gossypium arboreum]